jgi:hypothetical protein
MTIQKRSLLAAEALKNASANKKNGQKRWDWRTYRFWCLPQKRIKKGKHNGNS